MSSLISCGAGFFVYGAMFLFILNRNMDLEARLRQRIAARLAPRGAQAALAAKLTTHRQGWISRYLSGELDMDLPTLEQIATIWRVPLATLLGNVPLPAPTLAQVAAEHLADRVAALPEAIQPEAWASFDRTVTAMEASLRAGSASQNPEGGKSAPPGATRRTKNGR